MCLEATAKCKWLNSNVIILISCFKLNFQLSAERFGCIPPSIGNYGIPVCTSGLMYNMTEVDKLIDCPKPCRLVKVQPRTDIYEYQIESLAELEIRFHQTITISNDQYSYTWLNLVAEFGGYVGLFLGYSVFQITDLIDILFKRNWSWKFQIPPEI